MSKMDELRALREANYAQRGTVTPRATKKTAGPRAGVPPEVQPPAADAETTGERLCGHRAISGRTCTREHGHAAKSHRYS
jgi:hypothetical protein